MFFVGLFIGAIIGAFVAIIAIGSRNAETMDREKDDE